MNRGNKVWKEILGEEANVDLVQLARTKPANGVTRRTFLEVLGY